VATHRSVLRRMAVTRRSPQLREPECFPVMEWSRRVAPGMQALHHRPPRRRAQARSGRLRRRAHNAPSGRPLRSMPRHRRVRLRLRTRRHVRARQPVLRSPSVTRMSRRARAAAASSTSRMPGRLDRPRSPRRGLRRNISRGRSPTLSRRQRPTTSPPRRPTTSPRRRPTTSPRPPRRVPDGPRRSGQSTAPARITGASTTATASDCRLFPPTSRQNLAVLAVTLAL
jgi:hypothetical protein